MTALVHEFVRSRPVYNGLCFEEQMILDEWLSGTLHIDAVVDFSDRSWKIGGTGPIFGVFRKGRGQASWLIIRSGTDWGVADCEHRSVPRTRMSLTDVLTFIEAAQ